jgi:hypothetical protein
LLLNPNIFCPLGFVCEFGGERREDFGGREIERKLKKSFIFFKKVFFI